MTLRIGIVAGEASGDMLGASLMRALRERHPDIRFEGIGGPRMMAEGFHSLFPMDRLSVMGLVEPLKRLPELLRIRKTLKQHFSDNKPDLFLGIDSPDFTLNIEKYLRQQGVLTAHYVSPSVWAWRKRRVKLIAQAVDRMLTLLPFEADFYHQHGVPVTFVGHPLADAMPMTNDTAQARRTLGMADGDKIIALLPGSRGGEVQLLGPVFIETARWCCYQQPGLRFLMPAASKERYQQLHKMLEQQGKGLPIQLIDGQSHTVMAAADVVLMASGTTTLEAMLLKKPMVVAYKLSRLTYFLVRPLIKIPHFSLPNLLAGERLVPELLQEEVRPEMLGPLLLERLRAGEQSALLARFTELHETLRCNASERAAEVLLQMIAKRH